MFLALQRAELGPDSAQFRSIDFRLSFPFFNASSVIFVDAFEEFPAGYRHGFARFMCLGLKNILSEPVQIRSHRHALCKTVLDLLDADFLKIPLV